MKRHKLTAIKMEVDRTVVGEGANAARTDGSVNWIQRDVFDAYLTPNLSSAFADQLWTAMDVGE